MITYHRSPFGLNILSRISGSATYRAMAPGSIAVLILIFIRVYSPERDDEVEHPYAFGILVTSITFLLVFRVQQAYARYWEAASACHHFMSKWMDATMHTAVFHMQCEHYNHIKPPSFFEYPGLDKEFLTRDREDREEFESEHQNSNETERVTKRAVRKSIERVNSVAVKRLPAEKLPSLHHLGSRQVSDDLPLPKPIEGQPRLDGNWGNLFPDGKATFFNVRHPERKDPEGFASYQGGRTPPLFLQELAHLSSLLCGVALSTLRNDIEGSQSPLDIYEPGSPWPEVDPLEVFETKKASPLSKSFWYFLGMGRSPADRTRYNALRPLPVIGGVSEAEIRFLQMARGPYAKTQLCWIWLSEFITREHLAGSLGKVGPPIVSRIIQFLGDGMIYYNHARKIMFVPFPFPHAQLSAFYVFLTVPAVAGLMDQYADDLWLGCILTFFTVVCLVGIHEVARELENPFRNIPNELPLVTFQAQFNEALITMYAGYHPDLFWRDEAKMYMPPPTTKPSPAATKPVTTADGATANNNSVKKNVREPNEPFDEKIQELLNRIDQQGSEIRKLQSMVNSTTEEKKGDFSDYEDDRKKR